MQIGLERLINPDLAAHVQECRDFNAASSANSGPSTLEGLHQRGPGARPPRP
jgi:hypothetical protein